MTTTDLSKFGSRELARAADLLAAWTENKTVDDFQLSDEVQIMFNANSGYIFLTDSDFNVAMLNGNGKLENWVTCPNCGNEDFASQIEILDDDRCNECSHEN